MDKNKIYMKCEISLPFHGGVAMDIITYAFPNMG